MLYTLSRVLFSKEGQPPNITKNITFKQEGTLFLIIKTVSLLHFKKGSLKILTHTLPRWAPVMLHSCWNVCNSRCLFHNFSLKIALSRFPFPVSREFGLKLWIRHANLNSKFKSPVMCSDTKRLEMLIVLHIYLFLMSYNSSNMSFGDIETIVPYNKSGEMYCDLFLRKFDFWLNYSSDSLYIGFHSQSLRILW